MDTECDVLTAQQAAELLQIDVQTYRQLAARGDVPAQRVGVQWRSSRVALLEWIRRGFGDPAVPDTNVRRRGGRRQGRTR